jgi:predicted secreted hydrolase
MRQKRMPSIGWTTRSVGLALAGLAVLGVGLAVTFDRSGPEASPSPTAAAHPPAISARMVEDLLARTEGSGFIRPSGPWTLALPDDHGGHAQARAETWLVSAHLEDEDGRDAAVQFSLTRFGLVPEDAEGAGAGWALRALYRAHLAVLTRDGAQVHAEERFSRGAGAAGHDAQAGEVWLDDWTLSYGIGTGAQGLAFAARLGSVDIDLDMAPMKAPVQAAEGDAPFRGFAIPRLSVSGQIVTDGAVMPVSGTAWLDRAWGELPLPGGPLRYERLQAQLDDGTDLSLVRTGRRDGRGPVTVDGVAIDGEGEATVFSEGTLSMVPRGAAAEGDRQEGGAPVAWRISGPELDLDVAALGADRAPAFALGGWTGLVRIEGRRSGRPVTGLGTLQMTGNEAP